MPPGWFNSCYWYICGARSSSAFLIPTAFLWRAACWRTARNTDRPVFCWSPGATTNVSVNISSAAAARVRNEYQSLAGHVHNTSVTGIADCGSFVGESLD